MLRRRVVPVVLAALLVIAGIAFGQLGAVVAEDFVPYQFPAGRYSPKVDNFVVVLDATGSMNGIDDGRYKNLEARAFVNRMNMTLPEMDIQGALLSMGPSLGAISTKAVYGLEKYSTQDFSSGLMSIGHPGGPTFLDLAVGKYVPRALKNAEGKTALIIVSDGLEESRSPLAAARSLKQQYGDQLCIYTVGVGTNPKGVKLMNDLADVGGCGFFTAAADTLSSDAMADFVKKVFLNISAPAPKDSDGDGVYDENDQCPGTPAGVQVDGDGCPLDTDLDGVYDYLDKCPGTPGGTVVNAVGCARDSDGDGVYDENDDCPDTPAGAEVNARGCWILTGVNFNSARWNIRPDAAVKLDEVVEVLKKNSGVRIEIEGHTDSRGRYAYNKRLSQSRANSVAQYLIDNGIAADRLRAVGYGPDQPIADNATAAGRAKNRRVVVTPIR